MIAIVVVVQITLSLVVILHLRFVIRREHDLQLEQQTRLITDRLARLEGAPDSRRLAEVVRSASEALALGGLGVIIYGPEGEVLFSDLGAESDDLIDRLRQVSGSADDAPRLTTERLEPGGEPLRVTIRSVETAGGASLDVRLLSPNTHARTAAAAVLPTLLVAGPVAILLSGGAVWLIAGSAVRPLRDVRRFASKITPESFPDANSMPHSSPEMQDLHEELAQAMKRIEEGYRSQARFLSNVSHELKTPISVILTQAETLRRLEHRSEDLDEFIESVRAEMKRLGELVESFLMLTRVREGRSRVVDRIYPVNEFVMDSIVNCHGMAQLHGVELHPTIAESERDLLMAGDPELLTTALDNLIRNAIRFTPRGMAVEVTVETSEHLPHENSAARLQDVVRISVRDFGPGVPEDKLETIFDRFAQADEEERRGRGAGLGLEIAQSIAELHGGRITVGNLDVGCVFRLFVPLHHSSEGARSEHGSSSAAR